MIRVQQKFDSTEIENVSLATKQELISPRLAHKILPGERVAVCVGSRGIYKIDQIVLSVIQALNTVGAKPFIVPAMGSHGGATSHGQTEVLASYGITEQTMGVPIESNMDTVFLGYTSQSHIPIHISKAAWEADCILPINRIKAHTDFFGPIESGLNKMITIGLGKEKGCTALHRCGTNRFATIIPEASQKVLSFGKIRFGLAIIENGYDHTTLIKAVDSEKFLSEEPMLLQKAKALMPKIPFSSVDVLIVENFGKDISGCGMDPNITGRMSMGPKEGYTGPAIQRIVVLNLTPASHGNAIALNAADFITKKMFQQIDLRATYKNSLACCNPVSGQIPIIAETEEEAINMAIASCRGIDLNAPRIVRIKDTLSLDDFFISESLLEEAKQNPNITLLS